MNAPLPLEMLVSSFSGKTAQQITDLLNTDQIAWHPIPLGDLDAYASLKGVKVFLTIANASVGFDSPAKPAILAAIDLFSARFDNLDMQNPDVRDKVVQIMGALTMLPNSVVDSDFIAGLNALGSTTTNQAKAINGGELLTVDQVQSAMDRAAVRTLFTLWVNTAQDRINSDSTVPTLDAILATPKA